MKNKKKFSLILIDDEKSSLGEKGCQDLRERTDGPYQECILKPYIFRSWYSRDN